MNLQFVHPIRSVPRHKCLPDFLSIHPAEMVRTPALRSRSCAPSIAASSRCAPRASAVRLSRGLLHQQSLASAASRSGNRLTRIQTPSIRKCPLSAASAVPDAQPVGGLRTPVARPVSGSVSGKGETTRLECFSRLAPVMQGKRIVGDDSERGGSIQH